MSRRNKVACGVCLFVLVWVLNARPVAASSDDAALPAETKEQRDVRMAWWREARFGMFIHWGVYSIPAGVWKGKDTNHAAEFIMADKRIPMPEYEELPKQFNPTKFDAAKWARIAKNAGMRYVVLTSKHHDGFCMFDSKLTDFDIMSTPFHRDVAKELADAVRAEGLRMGFYYSIMDWHHPDYVPRSPGRPRGFEANADFNRYIEYMKGQTAELLTHYGPISEWWWDGAWQHNDPKETHAAEIIAAMRAIQPNLVMNDRSRMPEDFGSPEQFIPGTGLPGEEWETCMTMNGSWGFRTNDHKWKSKETLIHNLIDIVSKGGNYLLNVGPTSEGEIPPESVERLEAMGKWLSANGEAIYGTTASPFKRLNWGRCTQKPGKLYLHVFDWPVARELLVPGLKTRVSKAYLLSDALRGPIKVMQNDDDILLTLPAEAPDPIASVVVLELIGPVDVEPYAVIATEVGALTFPSYEATIHGKTAHYEFTRKLEDHIADWTDAEEWISWDFKVKSPGSYHVEITYSCDDDKAGGDFVVDAGNAKLTGKVESTGQGSPFVTKDLGVFKVDAAGRRTLAVRAKAAPKSPVMNLKSIVLKPAS